MKEVLSNYIKYLEKVDKKDIKNKEKFLEDLLKEIQIYQHERLIHLIVTVFVGIVSIIILGFSLIVENILLIILLALLIILFIPYILHYYFLENGVQKLYKFYWDIKNKG